MGEPAADRFDRANQLFSDALELAPEERDGFVRQECGTDTALCESVLKLLSRFHRLGDFLEKPAGVETRLDLAPGDILDGRIRIVELHGRGGMGEVYRAEDTRLGEPVAIKIVRAEWRSDPGMLARFHDEIRLARRVSHPNVCRVHGIVSADVRGRELLCLEMEYLAGDSLAALLESRGKLDAGEMLGIAEGVAAGLDAAHREGVVHRDLKPGNIILARDRRGGERPVITDFGLARADEAGEGARTQSGVIAGSPDYMAPEQFLGEKLTAAVDVFALGLIVYEMAAGRRAFPSESIMRAAMRRLTEDPQPLSRVAPDVPRHWDRVLARALARDPARRYATAAALVSDLRERPSLITVALSGIRAPRISRRAWLAGAGAAGAAAVSSFYAISRLHHRALPDAPLIMLMPLTSSASPGNAAALGLQIEKGLQQSAHVRVLDAGRMREAWKLMGHATALPAALTTRDAREIALRENAQFVLFGSLEKVADGWAVPLELELLGNAPDYPREKYPQSFAADSDQGLLTAAARAVAWIRRTAGESPEVVNARSRAPEAITTKSWAALQEYMQAETAWRERQTEGRWLEDQSAAAELNLKHALELDPGFALATTRLADIQMASGQTDDAFATYERAVRLLDAGNATDKESFETRALFALDTGRFAEGAEICARYALAYPRDMRPLYLEATCVEHLGDRVAALHLVEQAIERDSTGYSPQVNRAIYLLWLGRFADSQTQLDNAARIYDHDWTDHVGAALAFARRDMPGVWRGLERMRNAGTMEYRSRAYMLEACLHAEQAHLSAAERVLKQGLEFDRENRQPNETMFTKYRALALVYIHQGKMRDAVDCCNQILAARPGRGAVLDTGIVLTRAGEFDAARRCIPDGLPKDPPAEPPTAPPAGAPRELMEWPYYWRRILLLWGEMALQQGDAKRAFRLIASAPLPNPSMQWPEQLVRASVLSGERETAKKTLRLLLANPAAYWMASDFDSPGFIREALLVAQRSDNSLGDWASWKHFLDTKS
jgi:serine/threonine protein kinase/tetratricopeptide (TPR) repeat protein